MRRRSDGIGIGDALGPLVSRLDKKGGMAAARVAAAWPRVVGPEIEAHTGGVYIRGTELVVKVDSAIWANELQAMSEHILDRLRAETGQTRVESVRFQVSHRVAQERMIDESDRVAADAQDRDKVDSVPLSKAEREQVRRSVGAIKDPALREIAERATIRDLEWKKGLAKRG